MKRLIMKQTLPSTSSIRNCHNIFEAILNNQKFDIEKMQFYRFSSLSCRICPDVNVQKIQVIENWQFWPEDSDNP